MLNGRKETKKQNVSLFLLVGVSHRLTRSTQVYVDREGETSVLKRWNIGGGGDSWVMQLLSKPAVRRLRGIYVMLIVAGIAVSLGAD